ncbi:MAG: hypothetical protein ACRDRP_15020, partial [Pseudonocardiaceae bacterium]
MIGRGVPRSYEVEDLEGSVHEAGCPSGGLGDVASAGEVDGAYCEVGDCKINGVTPEAEEVSVTVVAMDVPAEPVGGVDEALVRQLTA